MWVTYDLREMEVTVEYLSLDTKKKKNNVILFY